MLAPGGFIRVRPTCHASGRIPPSPPPEDKDCSRSAFLIFGQLAVADMMPRGSTCQHHYQTHSLACHASGRAPPCIPPEAKDAGGATLPSTSH